MVKPYIVEQIIDKDGNQQHLKQKKPKITTPWTNIYLQHQFYKMLLQKEQEKSAVAGIELVEKLEQQTKMLMLGFVATLLLFKLLFGLEMMITLQWEKLKWVWNNSKLYFHIL